MPGAERSDRRATGGLRLHGREVHGGERGEPRRWLVLPALAAAVFVVLALSAARRETPTVDEFAHVPAGVAIWRQGRTDLYRSNPPLKLLLAAPLALDRSVAAPVSAEPPLVWGPWIYGHRFMQANRERYLDL